mmetsp:Transcript_12254/g.31071  ORF Transcript_12254/g.31071 Transcript_12254/m.31071 type:complete len:221 (+) Transcript_12254:4083-4745(+)
MPGEVDGAAAPAARPSSLPKPYITSTPACICCCDWGSPSNGTGTGWPGKRRWPPGMAMGALGVDRNGGAAPAASPSALLPLGASACVCVASSIFSASAKVVRRRATSSDSSGRSNLALAWSTVKNVLITGCDRRGSGAAPSMRSCDAFSRRKDTQSAMNCGSLSSMRWLSQISRLRNSRWDARAARWMTNACGRASSRMGTSAFSSCTTSSSWDSEERSL